MSQQPVELILMRQLALSLDMPTAMFDHEGKLLFINEGAEQLYGYRLEDVGKVHFSELSADLEYWDEAGGHLAIGDRPVARAFAERRPVHLSLRIRAFDGAMRRIANTALPLVGQSGRFFGVLSILWELDR
jgi:PAS domain S-box-containing protein